MVSNKNIPPLRKTRQISLSKEIKLSLMEKETDSNENNKNCFIIRTSGILEVDKFLKNKKINDYNDFIFQSTSMIYDNLKKNTKNVVDSLGLWIIFSDDSILENSIDIDILNKMKKYGDDNVDPIHEFVKMTLSIT